jgi:hypothetical protein
MARSPPRRASTATSRRQVPSTTGERGPVHRAGVAERRRLVGGSRLRGGHACLGQHQAGPAVGGDALEQLCQQIARATRLAGVDGRLRLQQHGRGELAGLEALIGSPLRRWALASAKASQGVSAASSAAGSGRGQIAGGQRHQQAGAAISAPRRPAGSASSSRRSRIWVSSGMRRPYSLARSAVVKSRAEATSLTRQERRCLLHRRQQRRQIAARGRALERAARLLGLAAGDGRLLGVGARAGRGPMRRQEQRRLPRPDITHSAMASAMASPTPTPMAAPTARQSWR